MPDNAQPTRMFAVRMTDEELAQIETLRERMQTRATVGVRVTQRMVILAALERLQTHLDKLERDKGRDR